jgi:hypothetical protein
MKFTLVNNGNGNDEVTLSLDNAPTWVALAQDSLLIGPGQTATLTIDVLAPSDALGDHTFQVTATSSDGTTTSTIGDFTISVESVEGCTDSNAKNYDISANQDDGSCEYYKEGCMDTFAKNYNETVERDDGTCEYYIEGCMNSTAVNYLPEAEMEDNSCKYGPIAIAGKDITVIEGEIVQFSGAGVDSDGTVIKYEWDFDGDGVFEWSSEDNGLATFFYNDGGEYITTLRVTDDEGNTAADDRKITVIADVAEGSKGADEGEVPSISLIISLISIGLLAIFRRKN